MISSQGTRFVLGRVKQLNRPHLSFTSKPNFLHFHQSHSRLWIHFNSLEKFHSIAKRSIKEEQASQADSKNTLSCETSPSETAAYESSDKPRAEYELTFTCKPCGTRSSHHISKQGYHYGSVLIACPSCKNRHIISDHLKIFGHRDLTIEDLMREQGELVKKGTLSEDGTFEVWADGGCVRRVAK